jgi:GMP synthase (glutamine-hydrolysing)
MPNWTVLQHVEWEGPGAIAAEARMRGILVEIRRMDLGHALPVLDNIDGLIVMGGPMGVYDTDKHPFLEDECRLMANMVHSEKPVLGVCLGAQLLAAALGARVYKGPSVEVGFGNVNLKRAALADPVFSALPNPLPVFHWHGDTFDLPEHATLLAANSNYEHQAFRFGRKAYGLQFHLETLAQTWEEWKLHLPRHAGNVAAGDQSELERCGRLLFARFFDVVLTTLR